MKIALITDQHFGARNDSLQFHDYFEKFYSEFFFPYLEKEGITTIIELGDIFDRRKYINYDSLGRCRDYFFQPIADMDIKLHCIVGNHDIYFKNTNRVNSPNLVLGDYDFTVYDSPQTITIDGTEIVIMPWINNDNYEQAMEVIATSNAKVLMGHLELQGFEMYRGAVNDHGIDHKLFNKFDTVMSGHFHHKSSKDNIHYLGAPYEMTWSDYNDARGFHIFDTDTLDLTFVQNPYRMFHKLFYDDSTDKDWLRMEDGTPISESNIDCITNKQIKVIVKNKNPYTFDVWMDRINAAMPAHIQVVEDNFNLDIEDADDIINEAEDTVTIINKYISNLDLEDVKPIEKLFHELYHEALSIE